MALSLLVLALVLYFTVRKVKYPIDQSNEADDCFNYVGPDPYDEEEVVIVEEEEVFTEDEPDQIVVDTEDVVVEVNNDEDY